MLPRVSECNAGGRLLGTFGDCGIVSGGPGKVLSGSGGGVLVTNSDALYEKSKTVELEVQRSGKVVRRVLGFWLWRRFRRQTYPFRVGLERFCRTDATESFDPPSRASNVEAGITIQQMIGLDRIRRRLREDAEFVRSVIQRLPIPDGARLLPSPNGIPVKLVLLVSEASQKREVITLLREHGIEANGGYVPCHLRTEPNLESLPMTMKVWQRVVWVPVYAASRAAVEKKLRTHLARLEM